MKAHVAALATLAALVSASVAPDDAIERCWKELQTSSGIPACLERATAELAPAILEDTWRELGEGDRQRFRKALASELARRLEEVEGIELLSEDEATGHYRYRSHRGTGEASLYFGENEELRDVVADGRSAVDAYREMSERLLDRFSFPYLVAELDGSGVVVLEDFEDDPIGELPEDWSWRGWGEVTDKPYRVLEERGNRFLRAEDRGENVMLYKRIRWSSRKYPYLSWRWRIRAVPEGADERLEDKADSAAGLYLSYRRKLGLVPETVKFVFSGALPVGIAFRRPGIGMPWTVVAGSGPAEEERWRRLVYRTSTVYRKTFEGDPGGRPLGIGLLSDANSTESFASADYDDIVALERADSLDTIREIVELQ